MRRTPQPTDAQIRTALTDAFVMSDKDLQGSCVKITREGTRMTIHWFGGFVHDMCDIDGDMNYQFSSSYWEMRREFATTLGVAIEDRYAGWDLYLREDY